MQNLADLDHARLLKILEKQDAAYDEEWKGPRSYLDHANYHTRLAMCTVHGTVPALDYALALLDSGRAENLARALDVLDNVLQYQDTNPIHPTYGIWPWYMEEPLAKMNPPDWNWADFCGRRLLLCLACHADRMPPDLRGRIQSSLRHACLSIFRRNVDKFYTNISIMGAMVTLCSGERFGWDDMLAYGLARLNDQWEFVRENGTFAEFNSPTYTVVAMEELACLEGLTRNREALALVHALLDMAWKIVAEHYHAPTGQWVGPCSRAYSWLQRPGVSSEMPREMSASLPGAFPAMLSRALDDPGFCDGDQFKASWIHAALHCPDKYRRYFYECPVRDLELEFHESTSVVPRQSTIARSHIEPAFALSSFARQDTWNQRRNLFGFWGGRKPRFVNMTLLHNLYDFSSGLAVIDQKGGTALLGATLMTDAGDTHISLDMVKDATIRAWDLRLRIELGGLLEGRPVQNGDTIRLRDGGIVLTIRLLGARFDGSPCALVLGDSSGETAELESHGSLYRRFTDGHLRWYADVVFYRGEEREFGLDALRDAWAALLVTMGADMVDGPASAICRGGIVTATACIDGRELSVSIPEKPSSRYALPRGLA